MKSKMVVKVASSLVNVILFSALILMAVVVISAKASGGEPNFMGYQVKTVLSGSMEPTFQTGSVIAIDPDIDKVNLQKGDVITFLKDESTIVTHRIIEAEKTGDGATYTTKGDNNANADGEAVISDNVIGTYTGFTIPYLGYMLNFANSKMGSVLLMIVPGVLLLIYSGFTIWRAIAAIDVPKKEEQAG